MLCFGVKHVWGRGEYQLNILPSTKDRENIADEWLIANHDTSCGE